MQSSSSSKVNPNIIQKLFQSFTELEDAIGSAKCTLAKRGEIPAEIMERLNSYDGILLKQRNLAHELCTHINQGDWDEVSRHVGLINGLSAMIRDDAKAILSLIKPMPESASSEEDDEIMNFC
jgi:hypothetical protein